MSAQSSHGGRPSNTTTSLSHTHPSEQHGTQQSNADMQPSHITLSDMHAFQYGHRPIPDPSAPIPAPTDNNQLLSSSPPFPGRDQHYGDRGRIHSEACPSTYPSQQLQSLPRSPSNFNSDHNYTSASEPDNGTPSSQPLQQSRSKLSSPLLPPPPFGCKSAGTTPLATNQQQLNTPSLCNLLNTSQQHQPQPRRNRAVSDALHVTDTNNYVYIPNQEPSLSDRLRGRPFPNQNNSSGHQYGRSPQGVVSPNADHTVRSPPAHKNQNDVGRYHSHSQIGDDSGNNDPIPSPHPVPQTDNDEGNPTLPPKRKRGRPRKKTTNIITPSTSPSPGPGFSPTQQQPSTPSPRPSPKQRRRKNSGGKSKPTARNVRNDEFVASSSTAAGTQQQQRLPNSIQRPPSPAPPRPPPNPPTSVPSHPVHGEHTALQSNQFTEVKQLMLTLTDVLLDIKTGQDELIKFVSKLVSDSSISAETLASTFKASSDKTLRGIRKCLEALQQDGAITVAHKKLKTVRLDNFLSYSAILKLCIPSILE